MSGGHGQNTEGQPWDHHVPAPTVQHKGKAAPGLRNPLPAESGKTPVPASLPIRGAMARPRDAPVTSQERPCSSLSPLAWCAQGLGNRRGRGRVVPLGQDG